MMVLMTNISLNGGSLELDQMQFQNYETSARGVYLLAPVMFSVVTDVACARVTRNT